MKDLIHKIKKYRSQKELMYLIDILNGDKYKIPQFNPSSPYTTYDLSDNISEYILFNINEQNKQIFYLSHNIIIVLHSKFKNQDIKHDQYKELIIDAIKLSRYSEYERIY